MTTYAVVRNAAGTGFIVKNRARGSSGAWVNALSNNVKRADATAFAIFTSTVPAESLSDVTFVTVPNRIFYV